MDNGPAAGAERLQSHRRGDWFVACERSRRQVVSLSQDAEEINLFTKMRHSSPTATAAHSLPPLLTPLPGAAEPAPQRHRVGDAGQDIGRSVTQLQVRSAGQRKRTHIVNGLSRL